MYVLNVPHMTPRFGQKIINNLLSEVCHLYLLYCNLRDKIYESIYGILGNILHKWLSEK